jgi:hypothetical protein
MTTSHERRRHSAAAQAVSDIQGPFRSGPTQDDLATAALKAADQAMVITSIEQLEELSVGARIWGAAAFLPRIPGSGSPYYRQADGTWFDYRTGQYFPDEDVMLPALLVKENT